MTIQWDWRNGQIPLTGPIDRLEAGQASWLRRITMIWLAGTLALLPLDFVKLPLNMIPVDVWILMGLPIFWLSFIRGKQQIIGLSYAVPMWIILVASFLSIFVAPAPKNGFIVVLKEVYAFVWFITLIPVLATLNARDLRRILVVWSGMVFLHGLVIVGQFLSPTFWRLTISLAGNLREFEYYRPSGLFVNANSAAFFQLLGFVPLMLASPSKKVAMILGFLLLPTMLLTGSMGATAAFMAGLTVAVMVISLSGRLALIIKIIGQLTIIILLLGGLLYFVVSQNQRYQDHFERILIGRSERSSEGRFGLWQRGVDAFLDQNVLLWGVGPENFREVDPARTDNQLHNDFLAFSVERGLLGTLGLVLFATLAVSRATYMVLICHKYPERGRLVVVVFLAAFVATIVESLTHQTFHFRELWLVLAFQEAMLFKMTTSESGVEPAIRPLNRSPRLRREFGVQPDVTGGDVA